MRVVEVIGHRYVHFMETVIACLVTADEKNGGTSGVKGTEDPDTPATTLHAEFAHMPVS